MPGLEDELGDVVRKARTGLGLSIEEVAARCGLSPREVKSIEVYTLRPGEATVRCLAEVLQLRPDPLWALAQDAWSAPDVPWSIGEAYTIDRLTNHYPEHCYVVTARSGECLIIDPGDEPERVIEAATRDGRRPVGILVTHRHQDHTGAVVPVQRATGAPVYVHAADLEGVAGVPQPARHAVAGEDEALQIGSIGLRALHTPGHTPGSATFVVQDDAGQHVAAFCGDTLFAGSAGNARHSYPALLRSLRQKLARLPSHAILYPGHGPATTVANERERNPFLL